VKTARTEYTASQIHWWRHNNFTLPS